MTGRWSESLRRCPWEGVGTLRVSTNHIILLQVSSTSGLWKPMLYPYRLYSALSFLLTPFSPTSWSVLWVSTHLASIFKFWKRYFTHLHDISKAKESSNCQWKATFSPKFLHVTPTSQSILLLWRRKWERKDTEEEGMKREKRRERNKEEKEERGLSPESSWWILKA